MAASATRSPPQRSWPASCAGLLRDLGVSKGDVETLRVAASSAAGNIYEMSGSGQTLRAFRDAAKEDKEYTAQQREHAKGIAENAIAEAIRKVKQP